MGLVKAKIIYLQIMSKSIENYFSTVLLKYLKLIPYVKHNLVRGNVQGKQNQVSNFNCFQNHSKQLRGSKETKFGK